MGGVSYWAMLPHISSPLGGEGLNAALMDAADIAWKLALVVRRGAKPSLLDSYAIERGLADRHVLEVSDEVHRLVTGSSRCAMVAARCPCRRGIRLRMQRLCADG
jgi:2-polyprenyl-6-methoxyphenol hydroxylase-like FAD-dependent oxidoreductase